MGHAREFQPTTPCRTQSNTALRHADGAARIAVPAGARSIAGDRMKGCRPSMAWPCARTRYGALVHERPCGTMQGKSIVRSLSLERRFDLPSARQSGSRATAMARTAPVIALWRSPPSVRPRTSHQGCKAVTQACRCADSSAYRRRSSTSCRLPRLCGAYRV